MKSANSPNFPGGERALIVFEAAGSEETKTRAGRLMGPTLSCSAPTTGRLECIGAGDTVVTIACQEYKILISDLMSFVKPGRVWRKYSAERSDFPIAQPVRV